MFPLSESFPGGSDGKESACNAGDLGLIPGLGRSPAGGNGYPTQYSFLGNIMDRVWTSSENWWWTGKPGMLQSMGRKELDTTEWLNWTQKQECCKALSIVVGTQWMLNKCFHSITQSCPTLCNTMYCSTLGFPVHHQLLELAQTHVNWVSDAIQPSHPLSSPSPPAFNVSWHQGLFQWVSSSHQVAKVLEFQLQH